MKNIYKKKNFEKKIFEYLKVKLGFRDSYYLEYKSYNDSYDVFKSDDIPIKMAKLDSTCILVIQTFQCALFLSKNFWNKIHFIKQKINYESDSIQFINNRTLEMDYKEHKSAFIITLSHEKWELNEINIKDILDLPNAIYKNNNENKFLQILGGLVDIN